tara:strand:- start:675 stop:815 length:141 start_codon:yes stop_codon:yes gene_type:complete
MKTNKDEIETSLFHFSQLTKKTLGINAPKKVVVIEPKKGSPGMVQP